MDSAIMNYELSNYRIQSIRIAKQVWMTSDLKVLNFKNGEEIRLAQSNEEWELLIENHIPAYCNGIDSIIYNWYAISDPRGLAPQGWRIPTMNDWEILIGTLGDQAESFYKEGFNCFYNCRRSPVYIESQKTYDENGDYDSTFEKRFDFFYSNIKFFESNWWSSPNGHVKLNQNGVYRNYDVSTEAGYCVRCISDEEQEGDLIALPGHSVPKYVIGNSKDGSPIKMPSLLAMIALLFAILPLPYAYFILLRLLISGLSLFCLFNLNRGSLLKFFFIGTLVLFNPIIPIFLSKDVWVIIDIICAFAFGAIGFSSKNNEEKTRLNFKIFSEDLIFIIAIALILLFIIGVITKSPYILIPFILLGIYILIKFEKKK